MNWRSKLGSLQLPVAGGGLFVVASGAWALAALLASPSTHGDGFVEGLAALFLYVVVWAGFIAAGLGLAIPPGDGLGIQFTRWQRWLFLGSATLAFASAIVPFVLWTVVVQTGLSPGSTATVGLGLMALSILAFVGGLCWRVIDAIRVRLE